MKRLSGVMQCIVYAALVTVPGCGDQVTDTPNPAPVIASLSVSGIERGSPASEIVVTGSNFVSGSILRINGSDRATAYLSASQLRATIVPADMAADGVLQVTVFNPAPGGGVSNTMNLAIVAPIIVPGQTVQESTSALSGVREFRIRGTADETWVLFAQTVGAQVEVILADSADREPIIRGITPASTTELEEWSLGRWVLPRTATYLVRIFPHGAGTYQFRIDAIGMSPEDSPPALAADVVVSESIDNVGDVDEFVFTGATGQEFSLMARLDAGMSDSIVFEFTRGAQVLGQLQTNSPHDFLDELSTGRFALPADGDYTLRVYGPAAGRTAAATGTYLVELHTIDRNPSLGAVLALDGPEIEGVIERPGDVDDYHFAADAGQSVVIHLNTPGTMRGSLGAFFTDEFGQGIAAVSTEELNAGHTLLYSFPSQLLRSTTYTVRVSALYDVSLATGPYTLAAYTVSREPESVAADITVGETISAERIDRPGDSDHFTFRGEPGQLINIFLQSEASNGELVAMLGYEGQTPLAGYHTFGSEDALDGMSTGRIELADTAYVLRVSPSPQAHLTWSQGAYALRVFEIDRDPEGRSAQYVPGDTVSGEPLYPAGDIDEYVFQLAQTTQIAVLWDAPSSGLEDLVSASLVDQNGATVWNSQQVERDVTLDPGAYRLSILNDRLSASWGLDMARLPTLTYRFALVPQ